ncbi:MAG: hypothetical protein KJS95_13315 [Gammaproteobacteria bacterium]|nr:hypothetical protein [Gammaproteobacteria bacterium]
MNTIAKIILWVLAAPFLLMAGGIFYETWNTAHYRFRLTFEIETPGGIRTASGVIEGWGGRSVKLTPESGGARSGARGDAIFIDLGNGRHVIATLTFPAGSDVAMSDLAAVAFERRKPFWYLEAPQWRGRTELPDPLIPLLVTFGDLTDPRTVRVVPANDIAGEFGGECGLKRVTLEMVPVGYWPLNLFGITGEPITRGIEKRLPWFGDRAVFMPPGWLQFTGLQRHILASLREPFALRN